MVLPATYLGLPTVMITDGSRLNLNGPPTTARQEGLIYINYDVTVSNRVNLDDPLFDNVYRLISVVTQ